MLRRAGRRETALAARLPSPLRPIVGGIALVVTVRTIDAIWRRGAGRPTPVEVRANEGDERASESTVVRDRLAYALLLSGAVRIARRFGLSSAERP
jgi:hypothetical protein